MSAQVSENGTLEWLLKGASRRAEEFFNSIFKNSKA
jgi:hypothetical protein